MPRSARELSILTRDQGVRKENPLLKQADYYPSSKLRTPALRKDADSRSKIRSGFGLKVSGKKVRK